MKKTSIFGIVVIIAGLISTFAFAQEDKGKKEGKGKSGFVEKKCNSCHSVEFVGIKKKPNQKPPDLSTVGSERSPEWIAKFLRRQESIEGRKHLIPFSGSDEDLTMIAEWLASLKADKKSEKK